MSYYTRFADVESLITSTTTAQALLGADNLLVFNNTDNKYHKTTVSALGASGLVSGFTPITTTTSTATVIAAVPQTFLFNTLSSAEWSLSTPANAGIVINFMNTSSTSTFTSVRTESTGSAVFVGYTQAMTAGGGQTLQFTCSFQTATIVSGFSTSGTGGGWMITQHSSQVLCT